MRLVMFVCAASTSSDAVRASHIVAISVIVSSILWAISGFLLNFSLGVVANFSIAKVKSRKHSSFHSEL